jgi:hypothetical protein
MNVYTTGLTGGWKEGKTDSSADRRIKGLIDRKPVELTERQTD